MRRAPDVKDGVVAASATTEQGWYCALLLARMAQTLPHAGRTLNRPLARDLPRDEVNGTLAKARAGGCASAVVPGRAALRRGGCRPHALPGGQAAHTGDGMFLPVRFVSGASCWCVSHMNVSSLTVPRASHLEAHQRHFGMHFFWRYPLTRSNPPLNPLCADIEKAASYGDRTVHQKEVRDGRSQTEGITAISHPVARRCILHLPMPWIEVVPFIDRS